MKLIDFSKALSYKSANANELREEYHKRCYELFDSVNGDDKELIKISNEEGISAKTIRTYAKKYYDEYIEKETGKTWQKKYYFKTKHIVWDSPNILLLLKLREEERPEVITELIKESGLDASALKGYVTNFVVTHFPDEKDYLCDSLKRKLDIFLDIVKDEKKKERQQQKEEKKQEYLEVDKEPFEKEKFLLENFIVGNYENKQQYCYICNINMKYFDKLIERAKIHDINLFNQYKEVIDNDSKRRFAIVANSIRSLVSYIKNGIKVDDNDVRDFDIIDYYLLIKLKFETILAVIKDVDLTNEELKILKTFITKNKDNIKDKSNEVHQILNTNNKQIIGGRVIELAEKELILNFLKKNNIPKNRGTYNIALRRYLNNTLIIDEVKGNTKV